MGERVAEERVENAEKTDADARSCDSG